MRQAQWTHDGLQVVDASAPPLQRDWVRLTVAACGICGSDLHAYRGQLPTRSGGLPGHECVGVVIDGEADLPDRLYAVEPWVSCGQCAQCLSGNRQVCINGSLVGGQVLGGLAQP